MKSKVEFIEESHTYVNSKGIVIPSVSELIRFKFPNQYEGVPEAILKKKASYGSKTHKLIEDFIAKKITLEEIKEKRIDPNIKLAVEQFELIRKNACFYVKEMEQIVDYKEKYAGQFDLLVEEDYIVDLKTTTELHIDWLEWQLGLYYLALGVEKDLGYALWLPKGKTAKLVPINVKSHEECKELVKDYEKYNAVE